MACSSQRPTGTRFIYEAGVKLCFCDESIATACVYYHMFHQVMDKKDYNDHLVIMAVLSLAAKTREMRIKLSDVVNTCHRCLHPNEPVLEVGDVYWHLKDSVARYELLLLRALHFDVYITMPHSYLMHYLLALSRWVDGEAWSKSCLPSVSLSLLQDTYHTLLPLSLSPHTLATAVLYLSVLCCRLSVPGNARSKCKWWEVFNPETTESELQDIARRIMAIYDRDRTSRASKSDTSSRGDTSASKTREESATEAASKRARKEEYGRRSESAIGREAGKEASKTDDRTGGEHSWQGTRREKSELVTK